MFVSPFETSVTFSVIFVKHSNLPQTCPDVSTFPEPFCFLSCFCSLLMWPFNERLQNWVETHWFSSLRPRSIRGGRCIFKDAGETIDNGSGFYVRRFLKKWVVAWQTLNNMVINTRNSSVFTSTLLNAGYILVYPHRGQVLQSRPKEEVQDLLQTFPSRFTAQSFLFMF